MMRSEDVGTVLVTDDNKPVGIITDRDLVLRCLAPGKDCSRVSVEEIMSTPIQLIKQDASILDLIEEMSEQKLRRICIVDENEEAIGVVSMADVFELLAYEVGQLSNALGERHEKLFRRTKGKGTNRVA